MVSGIQTRFPELLPLRRTLGWHSPTHTVRRFLVFFLVLIVLRLYSYYFCFTLLFLFSSSFFSCSLSICPLHLSPFLPSLFFLHFTPSIQGRFSYTLFFFQCFLFSFVLPLPLVYFFLFIFLSLFSLMPCFFILRI